MSLFHGVVLHVERPPSYFSKALESKVDRNKSRGLHTLSLQQLFILQAELLLSPTLSEHTKPTMNKQAKKTSHIQIINSMRHTCVYPPWQKLHPLTEMQPKGTDENYGPQEQELHSS